LDHPSSLTHAKARLEADPQYQPWSMAVSRPHITGIGGVPSADATKSIGPSLRRCWCKNSAEIEIRDRAVSATPVMPSNMARGPALVEAIHEFSKPGSLGRYRRRVNYFHRKYVSPRRRRGRPERLTRHRSSSREQLAVLPSTPRQY